MAATAPSSIQTPTQSISPSEGFGHHGVEINDAKVRAVVERPENHQAADEFLDALDQIDPSVPRSDDLTMALATALSATNDTAWKAEQFAQQSLKFEFQASILSGKDQIDFLPATLSLIIALLHHGRICCLLLEGILISLRKSQLALAQTDEAASTDQTRLVEAMACHNFLTEYLWEETDAEMADVARLVAKVSRNIEAGAAVSAFDLFLIGAYAPLHDVDAVRNWVRELGRRNLSALDPTLRLLVFDRFLEDETEIEAITPVTSHISKEVQSQYEENPYPRWRRMPSFTEFEEVEAYVAAGTGQRKRRATSNPQRAKVLIAGAGTGAHPISVAQTLPHAAVLAIDLSRASLAYATREAKVRGATNVAFAQADILKLSDVDVEFDLIESVGVLHHMEDPEAGLQALLKVLKPGGYLRLALYSKAARHAVNAARNYYSADKYAPGLIGIRAFRRDLIHTDDPALAPIQTIPDFFAASEFRDLVMHVQEHQFTLPQIDEMLKRNGLKFLGFSSPSARAALRKMPAKMAQRRERDLRAWDKYEQRNPDTFIRMYDFFCMKR
ncbi:class I SAM-dependent methyltransferase [uncultured Tateyamaria sp.]|uniref:class I SAM-dependent methyltransferase n=1 Tax=uncultured Tateyamaria sp. TaxID=455651 RepID=UPI00260DAB01|nr:class I SAM-dependent methyltransferase [uncultured Tateyamaria sp.]